MAIYYKYEADGSVKFLVLLQGQEYTLQTGTWTVNGGSLLVNFPKMKKTKAGNLSISADAVVDGEVTYSDGSLSWNFNDKGEVTATKISDEEYAEDVKTSKSFAPTRAKVGKTVKGNKCSFVVNSISFQDVIYPSDTSGYYNYSEASSGNTFVLAKVKLTNDSSTEFVPGGSTAASFEIDGESYDATVETDGGDTTGTRYAVDPKSSNTVYIYVEVGDKIKKAKKIKLNWQLPSQSKYFNAYYDTSVISYDSYEISK